MRIGYLIPEFPSQTHAFFWREARAWKDLGHDLRFISTRKPPVSACAHEFADQARSSTHYLFPPGVGALAGAAFNGPASTYFGGMPSQERPSKATGMLLRAMGLDLARLAQRLGLEHVHVHSCANAAHIATVCRLNGGPPYSLTLHGDLSVYGTGHASKFRHAAFVSVVTRALQDQVTTQLGIDRSRLPVIPMGVDTDAFVPDAARPASTKLHAVTVARLNRTKGHVYALEAIAQLRDRGVEIEYSIAGTGPEQENLLAAVERLKLSGQVHFLGSLGEGEVRALLHKADIFLLTSFGLGEAAPVSVMEAMACGLPVVCSRIGGTPELIDDGVDGLLVAQKDGAAIAEAIEAMRRDPTRRAELSQKARARATTQFDYRKNASMLADRIVQSSAR